MDVAPLHPARFDEAVALWELAGLTRPWNDPHVDLARAASGPSSAVLGGTLDDVLVATVMTGHDGHRGWLYYLAVAPALRGRGLGAQMVREAERWLRDVGAVKVHAMVRHGNQPVFGFYEAIGYEQSHVQVVARWLQQPD